MHPLRLILSFQFVMMVSSLYAQHLTDTIYTLPLVTKTESSSRLMKSVSGQGSIRNISESLRLGSGIFMRSYGNGQLVSLSVRGTSASQTDFLWNGIKLNNPSLGQVDLSLFSTAMLDHLHLRGIASSGNVGGELLMMNELGFDSLMNLDLRVSYGSFKTYKVAGKLLVGNRKISGATRFSYLNSNNDFRFINTFKFGSPREVQRNAQVAILNLMQQFAVRLNSKNTLHLNFWMSDAQRQIPVLMSRTEGRELQRDYSIRSLVNWKGEFYRLRVDFTTAWLHDVIRYADPKLNIDDKSVIQALRNNFMLTTVGLKKVTLQVEAGYDFERALVPAYARLNTRHIARLGIGGNYRPVKPLRIAWFIRQHAFNKNLTPFSASLNFNYDIAVNNHGVGFTLNLARNFRLPTLNDLYWIPGGNQNLKPEKSWDAEMGFSYSYEGKLSIRTIAYCKYVEDWIQWISNGTYWQPENVKRVLSKGVETSLSYSLPVNRLWLTGRFSYTYTNASNLDAATSFDQSKGKQLIYVPSHTASSSNKFIYRKWYLEFVQTYAGRVFVTTDNSQHLPGYYLLDIELGKDFEYKGFLIGLTFSVNNITDKQYQVVAQRAMPGRNFEGTLRFNFSR